MSKILSNPFKTQRLTTDANVTFNSVTAGQINVGTTTPVVTVSALVNCSAVAVYTPVLFSNGTSHRLTANFGATVSAANAPASFTVAAGFPTFVGAKDALGSIQGTADTVAIENCAMRAVPATKTVVVTFTAQGSAAAEHLLKMDLLFFA